MSKKKELLRELEKAANLDTRSIIKDLSGTFMVLNHEHKIPLEHYQGNFNSLQAVIDFLQEVLEGGLIKNGIDVRI